MPHWMRTGDVAHFLNCSSVYVRQLADQGKIPSIKTVGGFRLFRHDDVEHFASQWKEIRERKLALRGVIQATTNKKST
jgi:excisionase family DNA binding protein